MKISLRNYTTLLYHAYIKNARTFCIDLLIAFVKRYYEIINMMWYNKTTYFGE